MFTKEERLFIWKKERFMGGLVVLVQKRRR